MLERTSFLSIINLRILAQISSEFSASSQPPSPAKIFLTGAGNGTRLVLPTVVRLSAAERFLFLVGEISEGTAMALSVSYRYRVARERPVQAGFRGSQLIAFLGRRCEFLFGVRRHGTEHQLGECAAATIGVAAGKPYVSWSRGSARSAEAWAIVVPNASLYP